MTNSEYEKNFAFLQSVRSFVSENPGMMSKLIEAVYEGMSDNIIKLQETKMALETMLLVSLHFPQKKWIELLTDTVKNTLRKEYKKNNLIFNWDRFLDKLEDKQ